MPRPVHFVQYVQLLPVQFCQALEQVALLSKRRGHPLLLFLRRNGKHVRQPLRRRGIEVGQFTQRALDTQVRVTRLRQHFRALCMGDREALLLRQLAQLLVECPRQLLTQGVYGCPSLDPLQSLIEITLCITQILELSRPLVESRLIRVELCCEARILGGDVGHDVELLPKARRCQQTQEAAA